MPKQTIDIVRGMADDAQAAIQVGEIFSNTLGEIIAATDDPHILSIAIDALKEASAIMGARQVMVEAEKVLEVGQ